MGGRFLYFFPGAGGEGAAKKTLAANGLVETIQADQKHTGRIAKGPDGGPGLLLTNGPAGEALKYDAGAQEWQELGVTGSPFWIGWWTGKKPGPAELVRAMVLKGFDVKLSDGNEWHVPIARAFPEAQTSFPQTMGLVKGGAVEKKVFAQYQALHAFACQAYDAMMTQLNTGQAGVGFRAEDKELLRWAGEALRANYYAGQWELSALGAFDTKSLATVVYALIDWPTWEWWLRTDGGKKNVASDFYKQFDGFGASFQSMYQPSQT